MKVSYTRSGKLVELDCVLERGDRGQRIQLYETDGCPYATASVILPQTSSLDKDCVFIKDYSENTGMAALLIKHGIIYPEIISIFTGYNAINAYRMTEAFLDEYASSQTPPSCKM